MFYYCIQDKVVFNITKVAVEMKDALIFSTNNKTIQNALAKNDIEILQSIKNEITNAVCIYIEKINAFNFIIIFHIPYHYKLYLDKSQFPYT